MMTTEEEKKNRRRSKRGTEVDNTQSSSSSIGVTPDNGSGTDLVTDEQGDVIKNPNNGFGNSDAESAVDGAIDLASRNAVVPPTEGADAKSAESETSTDADGKESDKHIEVPVSGQKGTEETTADDSNRRGDFDLTGISPIKLPELKNTTLAVTPQNNSISGSDIPVDKTGANEDESIPKDYREYLNKLRAREVSDEMDLYRLQKQQEDVENNARWAKGFASIADATSAIANLIGTAKWGKSAEQSSGAEGISKQLNEYRDKYRSNMKDVRDRLDKTRNNMFTARKTAESQDLAKQRIDVMNKESDRKKATSELQAYLKQQGIDINWEKIAIDWAKFDENVRWHGVQEALRWAAVDAQQQNADNGTIRANAYADSVENNAAKTEQKEQEKEEEALITEVAGNYNRFADALKKSLYGDRLDKYGKPQNLTPEEQDVYNQIVNAKTKAEKNAVVRKYRNNDGVASFFDKASVPAPVEKKTTSTTKPTVSKSTGSKDGENFNW